jgi:hypothetical protein
LFWCFGRRQAEQHLHDQDEGDELDSPGVHEVSPAAASRAVATAGGNGMGLSSESVISQ